MEQKSKGNDHGEQDVEQNSQEAKEERDIIVEAVIRKRTWMAAGIGLVPIPLVDLAALTGLQLEMVSKLARLYDQSFSRNLGKSIIASLVGSGLSVGLSVPLGSFLKLIPLIGQTTGSLSMCISAGASTYAIGRVFWQHFESGGTMLNFDPKKAKGRFEQEYQKGKEVLAGMKANK